MNEILKEIKEMRVENLETQLRIQKESARMKEELKSEISEVRVDMARLSTKINMVVPFVTLFFTTAWHYIKTKLIGEA